MHAVLPLPVAEVDATAEQVGLEAGLAFESQDVAFGHGALERPELFDDADAVVRDEPQREPGEDDQRPDDGEYGDEQERSKHGGLHRQSVARSRSDGRTGIEKDD